jgi:cold shock CspA family protein
MNVFHLPYTLENQRSPRGSKNHTENPGVVRVLFDPCGSYTFHFGINPIFGDQDIFKNFPLHLCGLAFMFSKIISGVTLMQFGTVKKWDNAKGFGFITTDDDEELFVHTSDVDDGVPGRKLKAGQRAPLRFLSFCMKRDGVGFDVVREMKGDRAVRVRLAK